jgi:hypothetical protein
MTPFTKIVEKRLLITKLAARALTRRELVNQLKRLTGGGAAGFEAPWATSALSLPDLKRLYRKNLKTRPLEGRAMPLSERRRRFSAWKKTGLSGLGHGAPARTERGGDITLYTGGNLPQLRRAVANPKTRFDDEQYIPGNPRAQTHGLYGTTNFGYARKYRTRGKPSHLGEDAFEPGMARITVPRKHAPLVRGGKTEAFLTRDALLRHAKSVEVLPAAEAQARWWTPKPRPQWQIDADAKFGVR